MRRNATTLALILTGMPSFATLEQAQARLDQNGQFSTRLFLSDDRKSFVEVRGKAKSASRVNACGVFEDQALHLRCLLENLPRGVRAWGSR